MVQRDTQPLQLSESIDAHIICEESRVDAAIAEFENANAVLQLVAMASVQHTLI
jgi:hypothetical protein